MIMKFKQLMVVRWHLCGYFLVFIIFNKYMKIYRISNKNISQRLIDLSNEDVLDLDFSLDLGGEVGFSKNLGV